MSHITTATSAQSDGSATSIITTTGSSQSNGAATLITSATPTSTQSDASATRIPPTIAARQLQERCYKLQTTEERRSIIKNKCLFMALMLLGFLFMASMCVLGIPLLIIFAGYLLFYVILKYLSPCEDVVQTSILSNERHWFNYYLLRLKATVVLLLCYVVCLVVWMVTLKIHPDLNVKRRWVTTKKGWNLVFSDGNNVTWSLVSLVLAAFLLLLKQMVLLKWKAENVYYEFRGRILIAGFQLYFLSFIFDGFKFCHLKPERCGHIKGGARSATNDIARFCTDSPIKQLFLSQHQYCLSVISTIDGFLKQASLSQLDIIKGNANVPVNLELPERVATRMGAEDALVLLNQLSAELGSINVDDEACNKWLVDLHEDCLSLAETLGNSFKVADILSSVLTCILFLVVAIFWCHGCPQFWTFVLDLEIRGVTTLVAGFVGMTYLARKPADDLITGLDFLFYRRPFKIGDRVMIDEEEMEITEMGLYKTTCEKIVSAKIVQYQYSDLQTKFKLVVLKDKPIDEIKLFLDVSTSADALPVLSENIRDFLGNDQHVFKDSIQVNTICIGSPIEIRVRFNHKILDLRESLNPIKSFRRKNIQLSDINVEIKRLLERQGIKESSAK